MLFLRLFLMFLFFGLGIVGLLLPILPGFIFFPLGVVAMFPQSRLAYKTVEMVEPKMPRLAEMLRRIGVASRREPVR